MHALHMTGVTPSFSGGGGSHHKSSLSSCLVPQRKVGTYINYCMYTNTVRDNILHNTIGQ